MPSAETHHDHAPTHTARRETDDVGAVWLRRCGFWAVETPGREDGSSAPRSPSPAGAQPEGGGSR